MMKAWNSKRASPQWRLAIILPLMCMMAGCEYGPVRIDDERTLPTSGLPARPAHVNVTDQYPDAHCLYYNYDAEARKVSIFRFWGDGRYISTTRGVDDARIQITNAASPQNSLKFSPSIGDDFSEGGVGWFYYADDSHLLTLELFDRYADGWCYYRQFARVSDGGLDLQNRLITRHYSAFGDIVREVSPSDPLTISHYTKVLVDGMLRLPDWGPLR